MSKPTIEELEKILDEKECHIEILPTGEIAMEPGEIKPGGFVCRSNTGISDMIDKIRRDPIRDYYPDSVHHTDLGRLLGEVERLGELFDCYVSIDAEAQYLNNIGETALKLGIWFAKYSTWYRFDSVTEMFTFIRMRHLLHRRF